MRVLRVGICCVLVVLIGNVVCEEQAAVRVSAVAVGMCPVRDVGKVVLGVKEKWCEIGGGVGEDVVGVIEGDEASLHSAINMVDNNSHDYVALLFCASWCPFSTRCRANYSIMSALYPTIPHFAIEESSIRPSILSKYGVHGFPTMFIINSTMRARYRGSRTLGSLVAFYSDVTGMDPVSLNPTSETATGNHFNHKTNGASEPENCPFSKARSPVNLLQQETYLALAITFVIMRFVYLAYPLISACAQYTWTRYARSMRLASLWEHPQSYLNGAVHLLNSLKDPFKKRNLQALNAKAWASKSLAASVSLGDASLKQDCITK